MVSKFKITFEGKTYTDFEIGFTYYKCKVDDEPTTLYGDQFELICAGAGVNPSDVHPDPDNFTDRYIDEYLIKNLPAEANEQQVIDEINNSFESWMNSTYPYLEFIFGEILAFNDDIIDKVMGLYFGNFSDKLTYIFENGSRSIRSFAARHEIPYSTMLQWKTGKATPPKYVQSMVLELLKK